MEFEIKIAFFLYLRKNLDYFHKKLKIKNKKCVLHDNENKHMISKSF